MEVALTTQYYVSAFLSAARSVQYWLRFEPNDRRLRKWQEAWETRLPKEDQDFLNIMREQRDAEIHRVGSDIRADIHFVAISTLALFQDDRLNPHEFAPPGTPPAEIAIMKHCIDLPGMPNQELSPTFGRYIGLLDRMLKEFVLENP